MTFEIHAWLADKDGYYIGELHAPTSPDDFATFATNAVKNGHKAIEMGPNPQATRPPDRPLTAQQKDVINARVRLLQIRQKPWSELTLAEQKQATDDAFMCGEHVPPINALK